MSQIDGLEGWAGEGPRLAITITVCVHLLSGANLKTPSKFFTDHPTSKTTLSCELPILLLVLFHS